MDENGNGKCNNSHQRVLVMILLSSEKCGFGRQHDALYEQKKMHVSITMITYILSY